MGIEQARDAYLGGVGLLMMLQAQSQYVFNRLSTYATRPQQGRRACRQANDGGFNANIAGAAIQHNRQGVSKFVMDVLRRGRADVAKAIGRRRRQTASKLLQQGLRHRVRWCA